jgi:sugar phosphate permease
MREGASEDCRRCHKGAVCRFNPRAQNGEFRGGVKQISRGSETHGGKLGGTHTQASRGRWYVLLLISVMYLITYLDRVNISTAASAISKEFGFDKVSMGIIFSAFVRAYAVFQVPGGWLSDRFGARGVLAGVVGYWSIIRPRRPRPSAPCRLSLSVFCSASARLAPSRAQRARCSSGIRGASAAWCWASRTAPAGSARRFAPPIVVVIMSHFGWRSVFYVCGAAGLFWSFWWYFTYRNLPEEHSSVNKDELATIRGLDDKGDIKPPPIEKQTNVPWSMPVRSPNMWAIMRAYSATSIACGFS